MRFASPQGVSHTAFRRVAFSALAFAAALTLHTAHAAKQPHTAAPASSPCLSDYGGSCADLAALAARGELAQVGLEFLNLETDSFGEILSKLYVFGIGLVGISALIMIIFGGVKYMTAAGSPQRIGDAKNTIWNALFGIALALTSWILLYTINPDLVRVLDLKTRLDASLPATSGGGGLVSVWQCSTDNTTHTTLSICTTNCSGGSCAPMQQ